MTGERTKPPGGESGEEPRSFAPPRPARTPAIGVIRQDLGEDPGDLAPLDETAADSPSEAGKNGRKLRDPTKTERRLPSSRATGGIGGASGAD